MENSGPPSPTSGIIINFAEVVPGIYRSSFPTVGNFEHLQSLGLKTILCGPPPPQKGEAHKLTLCSTLVGEDYPAENVEFMEEHGIQHYQIPIPAHKDPSVVIPPKNIANALRIMLDSSNYPLLVHCNKGKVLYHISALYPSNANTLTSTGRGVLWHVTGRFTIIGLLVVSSQSMLYMLDAQRDFLTDPGRYRHYAGNKWRALDEDFISRFNPQSVMAMIKDTKCITVQVTKRPLLPTPPASDGYEWEEDC